MTIEDPPELDEAKLEASLGKKLANVVRVGAGAFQALGVVAHEDAGNMLPFALRSRDANGELVETPIYLVCPRPEQRWKARARARKRAEDLGLDSRRQGDDAQDADIVKELERLEELAYAIRERDDEKPSQMYPDGEALQKAVPNYRVLEEVYTALDQWVLLNDPRFGELDGIEMWRVIEEIAKTGTTRPLWLIGGLEQIGCIIFSAREAVKSPMNPSLRQRRSTSPSGESAPSSESTPE
jgi:hypothetical protein